MIRHSATMFTSIHMMLILSRTAVRLVKNALRCDEMTENIRRFLLIVLRCFSALRNRF